MCIEAAEDLKELLFFSVGSISVRCQRNSSEFTIFDEIKSFNELLQFNVLNVETCTP